MGIIDDANKVVVNELQESHILRDLLIWLKHSIGAVLIGAVAGGIGVSAAYLKYKPEEKLPSANEITKAIEDKKYSRGDCLDFGYAMYENWPTIFAEPFTVQATKSNSKWREANEKDSD